MAIDFSETEKKLLQVFSRKTTFRYCGVNYIVDVAGKPIPSIGECKTDIYISARQQGNFDEVLELKISVKQSDHDFLENKISIERAKQILGNDAEQIIQKSIQNTELERLFTQAPKIFFRSKGKTEAKAITLGWKFEFVKRKAGKLSGKLNLNVDQKIDIYAGSNLDEDKKNSKVNEIAVPNSGIATHIYIAADKRSYSIQEVVENLVLIEDYVKDADIFFACKALNYRTEKDKWDGDRPLAVFMNWSLDEEGKLIGHPVFGKPLSVRGNECGEKLRRLLSQLGIAADNFESLKSKISEGIVIY